MSEGGGRLIEYKVTIQGLAAFPFSVAVVHVEEVGLFLSSLMLFAMHFRLTHSKMNYVMAFSCTLKIQRKSSRRLYLFDWKTFGMFLSARWGK